MNTKQIKDNMENGSSKPHGYKLLNSDSKQMKSKKATYILAAGALIVVSALVVYADVITSNQTPEKTPLEANQDQMGILQDKRVDIVASLEAVDSMIIANRKENVKHCEGQDPVICNKGKYHWYEDIYINPEKYEKKN